MLKLKTTIRAVIRNLGQTKVKARKTSKLMRSEEYQQARDELRKQFGKEPADGDIRWRMYAKESEKHQLEWNFGLYRNTLLKQAELLRKEKKFKQALRWYLLVNYYDMNGPQNIGGYRDNPEALRQYCVKVFDPKDKFFAPAVVNYTREVITELGFDELAVKAAFDKVSMGEFKRMKMPVTPAKAWEQIQPVLINGEEPWLKHKK